MDQSLPAASGNVPSSGVQEGKMKVAESADGPADDDDLQARLDNLRRGE